MRDKDMGMGDKIAAFMAATLGVVTVALILYNPSGDKAAAEAGGTLYGDIVGSFVKPSSSHG